MGKTKPEKEERHDSENNNLATPSHLKGKRGRKREAEKVIGEEIKPRIKKKKVIKKISREEEGEELKEDVEWEDKQLFSSYSLV